LYTEESTKRIRKILSAQPVKNYSSILIDGIFLSKAIKETERAYTEIYPDKVWKMPRINDLVFQLRRHARLSDRQELRCYVIESTHFPLRTMIDLRGQEFSSEEMNDGHDG
jgi:hypothetical protein